MSSVLIKNIGVLVSGDINNPILNADAVLVRDGLIEAVGSLDDLGVQGSELEIDVQGMTVAPGLIDSHTHVVIGDFTPRQNTEGFIATSLHGGITTMISAGESHCPGRPLDRAGTKALAILAHQSFRNQRPAGVKVHAGAVILEPGLTEGDFREMAAAGVWLVGEIGLGGVKDPAEAAPMVQWAKKYGMKVTMHTGGTSVPGSATVGAAEILAVKPDVVAHINGGPTAMPFADIERVVKEGEGMAFEMVHCGNWLALKQSLELIEQEGKLHGVIVGNDSPSGTGVVTLGILRTINYMASVCGLPGEVAIACASGNTARFYGLNTGIIEPGREADLMVIDSPPGSVGRGALGAIEAGDIPGVAMVMIDGDVKVRKSRITPPASGTIQFHENRGRS